MYTFYFRNDAYTWHISICLQNFKHNLLTAVDKDKGGIMSKLPGEIQYCTVG